jgi:hypothetical protein
METKTWMTVYQIEIPMIRIMKMVVLLSAAPVRVDVGEIPGVQLHDDALTLCRVKMPKAMYQLLPRPMAENEPI